MGLPQSPPLETADIIVFGLGLLQCPGKPSFNACSMAMLSGPANGVNAEPYLFAIRALLASCSVETVCQFEESIDRLSIIG